MPSKTAVTRSIELTEAEVEAFSLRLDKVLSKIIGKTARKLTGGNVSNANAASILGGLWDTIRAEGLDELMPEVSRIYGRRLLRIRNDFIDAGVKKEVFADFNTKELETLVTFDTQRVTSTIQNYVDDTRSVLMRTVLSGSDPDIEAIEDRTSRLAQSRIATELATMTAMFDRTVTSSTAEELGFELMIYLGPDDSVTRPFCQACLEGSGSTEYSIPDTGINIYTLDQIDEMDNGQGLPVREAGGGYNCRHQWRPISTEEAKARGWRGD